MNRVVIVGNNTKDIELRQTSSGTAVVQFSVAVKRSFKTNGQYESDFFECVAYNKTAEIISQYIKKGDKVGIDGRLQTRNYTNKEGRKVYVTEIIVENVDFLAVKKQENQDALEAPKFDDPFANANFEEVGNDDDLPF